MERKSCCKKAFIFSFLGFIILQAKTADGTSYSIQDILRNDFIGGSRTRQGSGGGISNDILHDSGLNKKLKLWSLGHKLGHTPQFIKTGIMSKGKRSPPWLHQNEETEAKIEKEIEHDNSVTSKLVPQDDFGYSAWQEFQSLCYHQPPNPLCHQSIEDMIFFAELVALEKARQEVRLV